MFRVSARTVLELGSELISSDVIAFYELIKNSFDAGSRSGAEIRFEIVLSRNNYLKFRQRVIDENFDVSRTKSEIRNALDWSAPRESTERFETAICEATDSDELLHALDFEYSKENRIIVSDEGTGMSKQDLIENYLVIGTASRKHAIDTALSSETTGKTPFLGEKGIGRLSVMRLGDRLAVETARSEDQLFNLLKIDWSAFSVPDTMLEAIHVEPEAGASKPEADWSGTRLIIESIGANWTHSRVRHLAQFDFARLVDPFATDKRRPRVAIFWNGERVAVGHMDRALLNHAHAIVKGKYRCRDTGPKLETRLEALDLGFEHPYEMETQVDNVEDLEGSIVGTSGKLPRYALDSLGEFEFEAYWYNRQRFGAIDSIGDRKFVREHQKKWSGILLFRDGFRVMPYGDEEDDWLKLDRRAMGSSGYLLNKAQFVGRVQISRLGNPHLVDQTNREGLRDGPEKQAFIRLLQLSIQTHLREFLKDVQRRHKHQLADPIDNKIDVSKLETRAKKALQEIERIATPHSISVVTDLRQTLFQISELYDHAQSRISEMEVENRQMLQMAGVGLMVEVVAHELARSTENVLAALAKLPREKISEQADSMLLALRAEMMAIKKRLRILDPLSVSGRQHRETFDLTNMIESILSGHENQFNRHEIKVHFKFPSHNIRIRAVKGMIVQILENLISNSLYWLDVRKQHEPHFCPLVTIIITADPLRILFEDNGKGIAQENREKIFRPFFSLKETTKRRGLGLYIARDCAEYNRGNLTLDDKINPLTGRLHRFILRFPEKALVK